MENKNTQLIQSLSSDVPELTALLGLNVKNSQSDLEQMVKGELAFLNLHALGKADVLECDKLSVVLALKSMFKQNLSLDPSLNLMYVKTRKVKTGIDSTGRDIYTRVLDLQPTCNGILSIQRQAGMLLDFEEPEIIRDANGKVTEVFFKYLTPTIGEDLKPKAVWKEKRFYESDFDRWRASSHKENGRYWSSNSGKPKPDTEAMNYANALYTSYKGGIDPEFCKAKCIRHAFKKTGTNPNEKKNEIQHTIDAKAIVLNPSIEAAAIDDEVHEATLMGSAMQSKTFVNVTVHDAVEIKDTDL